MSRVNLLLFKIVESIALYKAPVKSFSAAAGNIKKIFDISSKIVVSRHLFQNDSVDLALSGKLVKQEKQQDSSNNSVETLQDILEKTPVMTKEMSEVVPQKERFTDPKVLEKIRSSPSFKKVLGGVPNDGDIVRLQYCSKTGKWIIP